MTQEDWEASVVWIGVVAGCVIKKDDKYLLVQEKQQKVYGLWNLPAGHVDKGETIEQAAVREVREETGYDVELGQVIDLYHYGLARPLLYAFQGTITGGELQVQEDEILSARWFTREEIKQLGAENKLRADWVTDAIGKTAEL